MARKLELKPETILKNFSRYLYGQRGLSSTTVYNHVSAIRRLFPAIGFHPTARKANEILTNMRKAGLSYSHQANTSVALERYGEFSHVRIKLGRPKQPRLLVPNTMSGLLVSLGVEKSAPLFFGSLGTTVRTTAQNYRMARMR